MTVGSYELSNGKTNWYFVIDLPMGDDGKRRQHKRRGFPTKGSAKKAETEARKAYGDASIAADGSVAAELDGWLSERELDIEETTLDSYKNIIRMYVVPHIGGRQLYSLDKRVVQDMYKTLLREGGKDKKPLSPTTVRTTHRVLQQAFKDLGINLENVRQPRPAEREDHGRKGVWSPQQSKTFLRHHRDARLYAAWALAIVAGMRRGELAGLRWAKIDLDQGIVYVHIQRTICGNKVIEKSPKGKSRRPVAIGPAMVRVLREHKVRQDAEKAEAGLLYHDRDYVFPREDGEPYYPRYFTDMWEKACLEAGVRQIVLHDARHTSATAGADAGVPEHVMQKRLGHADGRTTREVYTHVLPESERKAAELMDSALQDWDEAA
ncbi:tyrosine recombinase XerD [Actinoplanes sp. SE50]|uniref:site-specific integrase n=1 Tax=unclassified Actinoplanes TaxID=2626549 RepID=UPI00023ECD61|nr:MULTISPECIES: site-specific integrase [unclassified Actinoplanes]AEV87170.1 Tyrosine recombinase xerD [Actinoplanes sp. SE50/110]ATO85571.1 tyrosine recombinase XerD [Actinoplanes sp. SE50]SLM02984.1 tyrosine recombinase XerD [Actinoplanes sp. SE50/110]